jgi:hypothetical protein
MVDYDAASLGPSWDPCCHGRDDVMNQMVGFTWIENLLCSELETAIEAAKRALVPISA